MELSENDGFATTLQRIIKSEDTPSLIREFKKLILASYGKKSSDGKSFIKVDPETGARLSADFAQSAAYDSLFMELATETDAAAAFVNGVIPKELLEQVQTIQPETPKPLDPQDPAFLALQAQANESRVQTVLPPPPPASIA
jgi:hypothetical protein